MENQNQDGTGLKKETAASLSYLIFFVTGILFLIMEKDRYVRFHALQSIFLSVIIFILLFLINIIPFLKFLNGFVVIGVFIIWLSLMYTSMQGKIIEIPILSKFVKNLLIN